MSRVIGAMAWSGGLAALVLARAVRRHGRAVAAARVAVPLGAVLRQIHDDAAAGRVVAHAQAGELVGADDVDHRHGRLDGHPGRRELGIQERPSWSLFAQVIVSRAGGDQALFVGVYDDLDSVAKPEFAEEAGHV